MGELTADWSKADVIFDKARRNRDCAWLAFATDVFASPFAKKERI
jgi:hypothetical protein